MKSKTNNRFILFIILGIFLALTLIKGNTFIFNNGNREINILKLDISIISGKIHIINNTGWEDFRNAGNCTGQGTYSDPYIIKDLEIDGKGSGNCILVQNTDVYFKIENCTIYNSGTYPNAGIKLTDVENSQLVDNNCSSNYYGIYLWRCNFNTVSGNTVNNNNGGMRLYLSYENNILGNTANNNDYGIYIDHCNYNNLIENTANNNDYGIYLKNSFENDILINFINYNIYGIYLRMSYYNTVSGNTLFGNDECIVEYRCDGNIFSNNFCSDGEDGADFPFELFISILSISGGILILLTIVLINRRKKKRTHLKSTNEKFTKRFLNKANKDKDE
jgi:parallel beta-helix repeat protein